MNKLVATDIETASDIENSHMMTGLETLGARLVNVVGVGGREIVLLEFVEPLVGSDAFT